MRSTRGLLTALAVLALTAGAALAAGPFPGAAHNGLDRAPGLGVAAIAADKTVPPGLEADLAMPADLEEPESEEPEENEEEGTEEIENHGATVSRAARGETPEGWRNHGAYVSAVARGLVEVDAVAPPEADANGGRMPKPDKPEKPPKPNP
jgi:hypothetical protein